MAKILQPRSTDKDTDACASVVTLRGAGGNLEWLDGRALIRADVAAHGLCDDANETVTTTISEIKPCPTLDRASCASVAAFPVFFGMACVAASTYLLIGDKDGRAIALHQMHHSSGGRWDVALSLAPGWYRYRFYAAKDLCPAMSGPESLDDMPIRMIEFASFAIGLS